MRRITSFSWIAVLGLFVVTGGPRLAQTIELRADKGAPGEVELSWTGGSPEFVVYRAVTPYSVVLPGQEIGETWRDVAGEVCRRSLILGRSFLRRLQSAPVSVLLGRRRDVVHA